MHLSDRLMAAKPGPTSSAIHLAVGQALHKPLISAFTVFCLFPS